jgi:hypothetical protein
MFMSSIGYRQKGDNGPLYNPERDYAYVTPTLMVRAIENLDPAARTDEAANWYVEHNISQDEIVTIAVALAAAQRDFVNGADPVRTFEQALNRRDFFAFRYPVRLALFAAIGEVFCAAWFKGVREVSVVGEESPAAGGMARFAAAVVEFAARNGTPTYNVNFMAEHLKMMNDVLQTRLNIVYKELQDTQAKLNECPTALATAKQTRPSLWQRFVAWSSGQTEYPGPK